VSATRLVVAQPPASKPSRRFPSAPDAEELRSGWKGALRLAALALAPLLVLAGLVVLIINVFGPVDAYEACASQRGQSVEAAEPLRVERTLLPVSLTCDFADGTSQTITDPADTAWPVGLMLGGLALTVVGLAAPVPAGHVRRLVEDSELTPHMM